MLDNCLDLLEIALYQLHSMGVPALIVGLLLGSGVSFIVILTDLSKHKRTQNQLRKCIDELADVYRNPLCGYHSLDQHGVFIQVNDTELNWLGYTREELVGKKTLYDLLTPAGQAVFHQIFGAFKQRGWIKNHEFQMIRADGSLLPVMMSSIAVKDAEGNFIMSRSTLFDMTEHKRAQLEALRDQDLRQAIFNESTDAIFLVDPKTLLTLDCNPRAVELYEADNRCELINIEGQSLQRHLFTPEELTEIITEIEVTGVWSRELEYVTCKGNLFWGNLAAKRIYVAGKQLNLVRVTDVTARRSAEEQIRVSLQEKELLLKEVHHRVKNNLHIISSLLDLQSAQIADQRLLNLFSDSQSRIQAMALIHEQLYQSEDFSKVEFGAYIDRLISNLSFSYGNRMRSVQPVVEAEPIQINLETAVPCGLLLNELVTNAFKHAFPNGRSGTIQIQIHRDDSHNLHLKICDDGVGFAPNINWQNSPSLGLKLIRILAKQLKASLTFDCTQGTSVHLTFTELKYRPRF